MKYILSASSFKILTFGIIIILLAGGAFVAAMELHNYVENKRVEDADQRFITAVDIAYNEQKNLDVGGPTPFDTLYRYTELLQINADKLASTYFTKQTRVAELSRMDGVSYQKRLDFIRLLKADQEVLKSINANSAEVKLGKPLPIVMKKAQNGVWQIESINYSF